MKKLFRLFKRRSLSSVAPESAYFEKISEGFGVLQIILYFTLFAFVVVSFVTNTHLITYQNFYLFFKDLNASVEVPFGGSADTLTYQTGEHMGFTLYRGGLAVTTENNVTLFSATGRQTLSKTVSFRDPVSVGSGKYLLVYEQGGYQYALFNSYSQIFEGKSEYPISDAAVSDAGMYALVTASDTHTTAVSLYSDRFSMVNQYRKNGYVTDVAIDSKGRNIAILTATAKDGFFESELMLCRPGGHEASAVVSLSTLGWSVAFTDSDRLAVLCESKIAFYNTHGEQQAAYSLTGQSILHADIGASGAVLCLQDDSAPRKKQLIMYDKSGKQLHAVNVEENIYAVSRCEDAVYWITDDHICRMERRNGDISRLVHSTADKALLAVDGKEILLCSSQKAEYVTF